MDNIDKLLGSVNYAEELDEEQLTRIGSDAFDGYSMDEKSREPWEKAVDDWTKLALQVAENKNFPWPNASNVKYPLLATAAMQFCARAYPALIPSNGKVVNCKPIGRDDTGLKAIKTQLVSMHMSTQLMEQMDNWEEDMDRMLMALPILGVFFKKTYWDSIKQKNCSKIVWPKDLVVNYFARSIEEAERVTQKIWLTKREYVERVRAGLYLEVDLPDPLLPEKDSEKRDITGKIVAPVTVDATAPYCFLEQHTYYDLDDDGYAEPVIITIERQTKQVVRIAPRFGEKGVLKNSDGEIVKIEPTQYFTKFPFIPNPDGSFYDIGFGLLLGALNESTNTLINQLVDGGTLRNLQSGFISKSLRVVKGDYRFRPGEWKVVNASAEELKNGVVPLPSNEPSKVLFELLGLMIQSGKELASISEIFTGKMPGQNTPATTTMATIEQGMKVFTAIYKRIFKAMSKEYKKLFELNGVYFDEDEFLRTIDLPQEMLQMLQQVFPEGFGSLYAPESLDVVPNADQTAFSTEQKLMKAQGLMQLLPLGTINPMVATQEILEAMEYPNYQKLLMQPQPQVDPKAQAEMMKMQAELQASQQESQLKLEGEKAKLGLEQQKMQMELQHKAKLHEMESAINQHKMMSQVQQQGVQNQLMMQKAQTQAEANKISAQNKPKPAAK